MSMDCMKWDLENIPLGDQERYFFLSDFWKKNLFQVFFFTVCGCIFGWK